MIKQKETYVSPFTETLELRFKAQILTGSDETESSTDLPSFTQDYGDWA